MDGRRWQCQKWTRSLETEVPRPQKLVLIDQALERISDQGQKEAQR